jgi:ABC-type phosphate/phosphonate transport system permease subunit
MLANLRALFGVVVDIILLRRGPEQLPASPPLMAVVVAINCVVYGVAYHSQILPFLPEASSRWWLLDMALSTLLTLVWFRVAFNLVKKPERFVQTMIAVFATNTLFLPLELALIGQLLPYLLQKPPVAAPALLVLAMCIVAVWTLAVLVRIVRLAFEWSWVRSIVFLFAGNIAIAIFLSILFGSSQGAA